MYARLLICCLLLVGCAGRAPRPQTGPSPNAISPVSTGLDATEQRLVEHVDAHNGAAVEFLEDIVNLNSGTMNFPGVKAVGDAFAPRFAAMGFTVDWLDGAAFQRSGHLLCTRGGRAGTPNIVMIGHLDTVFEPDSPFQRWERQSEHIVKGPGIADMKGGNVIIVQALEALASEGLLDDLTFSVLLIGDEEWAGQPVELARAALIEAAKAADIAIAFENGDNLPETAVISRRGSTAWKLNVTAKVAHSSQIFREDIGAGAIFGASQILSRFYAELSDQDYLTFNPGLILGGTDVHHDGLSRGDAFGKANVIAASAHVSGDLRSISPQQLAAAKRSMRAIVDDSLPGTTATIEFEDKYPPMAPTDGNRQLLAVLNRASQDLGFGPMQPVDPNRAGAADVTFTAGHVDMAIDGLGLLGDDEHSLQEWADLRTLPMQAKRTAVLLYRLSRP